jgi:hypothetical protein
VAEEGGLNSTRSATLHTLTLHPVSLALDEDARDNTTGTWLPGHASAVAIVVAIAATNALQHRTAASSPPASDPHPITSARSNIYRQAVLSHRCRFCHSDHGCLPLYGRIALRRDTQLVFMIVDLPRVSSGSLISPRLYAPPPLMHAQGLFRRRTAASALSKIKPQLELPNASIPWSDRSKLQNRISKGPSRLATLV